MDGASTKVNRGTRKPEPRSKNHFKHAAVAADAEECSIIGSDILKQGGSAADATIASLICSGLFSSHSSGIGGGNCILYYDRAEKKCTLFLGRETAPLAASENMYDEHPENSTKGGLAIGVPGEVSSMWDLHQRYGKLPWKSLFAPSIKWATEGFVVPAALGNAIAAKVKDIWADPNLREIFVKHSGCPDVDGGTQVNECLIQEGDTMTRPKLAKTLQTIADEGRDAFYSGALADDIIADISEYDTIITKADLEAYETRIDEDPVRFNLDGWTGVSVDSPGSGPVLALILNILEGYGLTPDSISNTENTVLTYHRMIEAFKFAYAKRSALGDENFVEGVTELVQTMISKEYADDLRAKITDDTTHTFEYYEPAFLNSEDQGTSHVSVLDEDGNACSATSAINTYFGSKVRGSRTGIIFNNEMDDFSQPNADNFYGLAPSPSNFIVPGKRPQSSNSPTIFTDSEGNVQLVIGASGGTRITTSVASVILHTKWLGKTISDAIEMPRLHDQLVPTEVSYGEGFDEEILERLLEDKGHNVTVDSSFAAIQGISRLDDGWLEAHSDSRKGGVASGY